MQCKWVEALESAPILIEKDAQLCGVKSIQ